MSFKIAVKIASFNKKALVLESPFNKIACLIEDQKLYFIKKKLQRRCFPVKFAKVLRTSFFRIIPVTAFVNGPKLDSYCKGSFKSYIKKQYQ